MSRGRTSALFGAPLLAVLAGCAAPSPSALPTASLAPQSLQASATPGALLQTMNLAAMHTAAPSGYASFCLRFPSQCLTPDHAPETIALTAQSYGDIDRINRAVNASIRPEDDAEHYGRAEYWTIPTDGYGDCEDYALTKRKALADAGYSLRALRMAVVDTPHEGRHAVLTVATDKGDLVLDNLRDAVTGWNDTGYRWIARQDGSGGWLTFTDTPSERFAATGALRAGVLQ